MMPRAVIIENEPLLGAELRDQLQLLWPALRIAGEAADGVAALALIDAQQPDIVFLDMQMPGLNGLEVAARLPPRCQVVFVTAHAQHALAALLPSSRRYIAAASSICMRSSASTRMVRRW